MTYFYHYQNFLLQKANKHGHPTLFQAEPYQPRQKPNNIYNNIHMEPSNSP